jgi:hypothetical protein
VRDIQLGYSQGSGKHLTTFKSFWCIILFWVPLFRYRNFWADLKEVGTRSEVSDRIRHDRKELFVQCKSFLPCTGFIGHTCCISSWSWVMRSICDNSCSISRSLDGSCAAQNALTDQAKGFPTHLHSRPPPSISTIMGNDGGSIPDRRDLVRNKPKLRPALCFCRRNSLTNLQAEKADKANQT